MNKTAERIRKEINDQKINRVSDNAPPDMEVLQSIDIDEDKATVRDKDGNELCRFYITIEGRRIFFKFPVFDKYDSYLKKFAELVVYLSRSLEHVEVTDNVELFKNPIAKELWYESSGFAISHSKRVRELVIDIFFNTLSAYVEDITIEKKSKESEEDFNNRLTKTHLDWFTKHITIDKLHHILHACFAVDELVKKKATLGRIIKSPLLASQEQCLGNISVKPPDLTPTGSEPIQYSLLKLL